MATVTVCTIAALTGASVSRALTSSTVDSSLKALNHKASTASTSCGQKVTVIGARGSGDPQSGDAETDKYGDEVHGMGAPGAAFAVDLANLLPRGAVTFDPVIYPAVGLLGDLRKVGTWGKYVNAAGAFAHVGFMGAYTGSVNDGKKALEQTVSDEERLCPTIKLVLVGYSQGAQVVGDVYQRNLTSQQRSRIVGVVLFGDPYFNPNDNASDDGSYDPSRYGILGKRATYPTSANGGVFSICHLYDPICQGPGRDDFSQHGNYQSDSWVGVAAAKIAARFKSTPTSGTVVDLARGTVGTLKLDDATQAQIEAAVGKPALVATGNFGESNTPDFVALGYACAANDKGMRPWKSPALSCETVYFLNSQTNRLAGFFSESASYHTPGGTHPGSTEAAAEKAEHTQAVAGCLEGIFLSGANARLDIDMHGGTATGNPLRPVGATVDDLALESKAQQVGLLFC